MNIITVLSYIGWPVLNNNEWIQLNEKWSWMNELLFVVGATNWRGMKQWPCRQLLIHALIHSYFLFEIRLNWRQWMLQLSRQASLGMKSGLIVVCCWLLIPPPKPLQQSKQQFNNRISNRNSTVIKLNCSQTYWFPVDSSLNSLNKLNVFSLI